jgi:hypothetical protein
VGEVGVHLEDQLGPGVKGAAKTGDVGGAESLLAGTVQHLDVVVPGGEPIGDQAGAVGTCVVDDEDAPRSGQVLARRVDEGLEVVGLVIGRQDQPDVARGVDPPMLRGGPPIGHG